MLQFRQHAFYTGLLLILSALTFPVAALNADTPPAQELIINSTTKLLNALRENNGSIKKDPDIAYQLAEDIILPHIDFRRIGRIVLGKYWRRASDEQRDRFVNEFRGFLVRTYVTAMVEFSDQIVTHADNVRYLPFRNSDPEDVTVRMEINLSNRPPVSVHYRLYLKDDRWLIYDLSVEGISLATTYRSSFASAIRRGGLDKLIKKLTARNAKAAAARNAKAAAARKTAAATQ